MIPQLSLVIVNWNSGRHLAANLASVIATHDISRFETIVVDNGSTDGSLDCLREFPWARCIALEGNTGFAAAANTGARAARAEILLFLNPDVVCTPGSLDLLRAALADQPAACGGCGLLVDPAGQPQRDFQLRRLPRPAGALADLLLPPGWRARLGVTRRHFYLDRDRSKPFPVEQPAAACLILPRNLFLELGGFDPSFYPAWFEDVDLARRLRAAGHQLWLFPEAVFIHHGGYSRERMDCAGFLEAYWRNANRYYRKHFPVFGRLYRWLFPLGAFLRCIASPAGSPERHAWRHLARQSITGWPA